MFKLLQTSAFVFGLSLADAITGFAIFAVGDSLADFSDAIISIVFVQIMGFSTCFGVSMVDLFLAVGISSS
ncbi:hypothetical protein P692DRAFT_20867954 [Suillus brevipes Sb2]|nr:hypothetical protein P692DRAFT_20867954 [Suillus brevipes Sb2]